MGVYDRWLVRRYVLFAALIALAGALVHAGLDLAAWTRRVAGSESSGAELARGVLLALPERLGLFLPLAIVLGSFAAVGQAALRGELQAQAAAGVSPRRVVTPVLAAAALLGLVSLGTQLWLAPRARRLAAAALWRADRRPDREVVRAGADGWRWCFGTWDPVRAAGSDAMLLGGPPGQEVLVSATTVRHDADRGWTLERGRALELATGRRTHFDLWTAHGWSAPLTPPVAAPSSPPWSLARRGVALPELEVGPLLALRAATPIALRGPLDAELWGRLALGLVPVAMAAAGAPIAVAVDRRRWPRAVAGAAITCWLAYAALGAERASAAAGHPWTPLAVVVAAGAAGAALAGGAARKE